jgi:hypothetical protein
LIERISCVWDADAGFDVSDSVESGKGKNVRSLSEAILRVRTAEAERSDVVVELRDAEKARLELLAEELRSVFADVPVENETFLFAVAGGEPPRLWIDMTAFLAMGRDRRTYRFLKDTRIGRTVILETADIGDMADCVTNYVAERIIERERALEGDWLLRRVRQDESQLKKSARKLIEAATSPQESRNLGWIAAAFLFGILLCAVLLLGWIRMSGP